MVLGDLRVFFLVVFYRLFSKPPLTKGLHFQYVCSVSVGKQLATAYS